ncbi:hypothetical protein ACFL4G_04485 [Thermodesulfobacteriota bacterium]
MSNLLKLKDLVQDLIDKGATSVEQIHKAIVAMPFETLEKIEPLENVVKSTKKIQESTIGTVYDVIRNVNKEVGRLAEELLGGADARKDDSGNY